MYYNIICKCEAAAKSVEVCYHIIYVEVKEKGAGHASLDHANVRRYILVPYLELHALVEVPGGGD